MTLENLFRPLHIGSMHLKNRIVMPPMGTGFADTSGYVTDQMIEYFAERARGGVGLIIIEGTVVSPEGKCVMQPCIWDDSYIPGFSKLSRAIKNEGACCAVQLIHSGRRANPRLTGGRPIVAPSPIAAYGGTVPCELTVEDIERLTGSYAAAAKRVRQAGFDAVEVHGSNAHLIAQFLSPLTNKRRDRYGGDLESRARFALEICVRVREEVGDDFPLMFRLVVNEYIKGGITTRDGQFVARLLEKAGVDVIDTSAAYLASSEEGYISQLVPVSGAPGSFPRGSFIHLAHAIKQAVSLPVIGVGRISDPRMADTFVREGKADLIAMGRPLIADPWLPQKAARGKYDEIRTCIACDTCYTHVLADCSGLCCSINPELGREKENYAPRAGRRKRVLVVGGGPAGLEAACVASSRGHEVVLLEKSGRLGGSLVAASAASFKKEIGELRRYLTVRLGGLPVKVELGEEAREEDIMRLDPEVVILATGAIPFVPDIPGALSGNVFTAVDVLAGTREVGQKVIVVGGGMVGCETAVFLAEKGKEVILLTRRSSDFGPGEGLAADMEAYYRRWLLFELWPRLDIEVVAKSTLSQISGTGVTVLDQEGIIRCVEGDSVVFALGFTSNSPLKAKLMGRVPELYCAGDCVQPRQIIHAVREGWEAGNSA